MKVLQIKLLREIYAASGLLLAITSIIAIGITCFVALQSVYRNLDQAKEGYYRQCRMADFWIDVKKMPVSELERLERIPGIRETRSRIVFNATVDLEHVIKPINGTVLSLPDRREPVLNDIVIAQGDYFTDRRQNEVIVNDAFARAHHLYPGQTFHLLLNNRRQELVIVGTAMSSEFVYLLGPGAMVPDPESYGVFYVKRTFAEDVFDFQGAANQVVGRLSGEFRDRPDDLLLQAERSLDAYGVAGSTPLERQASNQFLSSEIEGLGAFAGTVPVIFLTVAAVVLNVLITRLVRQQRVVVGTLKALGYSDREIFLQFLWYGLVVGIVGGLLGVVFGYASASGMTYVYSFFFEFPELRSYFYWNISLIGMLVSLACALAGSLQGARSVWKLEPAAAMRPAPPQVGGKILLERITPVWNSLSAAWRGAFRNVFRHKFRTGTGVFASAMGAGLLVTGFMFLESMDFLLDFQFQRITRSDLDVTFQSERGRDALDEMRGLPGVDYAEPMLNVGCTFSHGPYQRKGGITGLVENARLTVPSGTDGEKIRIPSSGIVLGGRLAEILHADVGSRITITPVRGQRRAVEVTVVRVSESYFGLAAYANLEYLSHQIDEEFAMSGAQLLVNTETASMNRLYHEIKRTPGVQAVTSQEELMKHLTDTMVQNQNFFIGMIVVFAGAIFFGSIVNASIVSLAERQREVATMRALGYGPWQVGTMFLRESLVTNLMGTLLGLPVGYLLVRLTAISYNNDLMRLPVVSEQWIWFCTFGLAMAFILASHLVVQRQIHRMDFLEALKVKE